MQMYYCEICDSIIEEEDLPRYTQSHPYGMGSAEETVVEYKCPYCLGDLEEVHKCPICDEDYIKEDEDLCEACFEKSCTIENCVEMGKEATEEYELNGFLTSVYSKDEVEACLLADFNKMPKHIQDRYITNYCGEDKYFFVDFLEEKMKNADLH